MPNPQGSSNSIKVTVGPAVESPDYSIKSSSGAEFVGTNPLPASDIIVLSASVPEPPLYDLTKFVGLTVTVHTRSCNFAGKLVRCTCDDSYIIIKQLSSYSYVFLEEIVAVNISFKELMRNEKQTA